MLPKRDREDEWNRLVGPDKEEADRGIRLEKNMVKHNNYLG
jgi:hypothetical protein